MVAVTSGCMQPNVLADQEELSLSTHTYLADKEKMAGIKDFLLGYPVNMNTPSEAFFAWRKQLHKVGIGGFAYNNVGNPYRDGPTSYHTHDFERDLILRFGTLLGFSPKNIWGFLSHSGTDSNMYGMYMGRTLLKGLTGVVPKCYFTKEAHYSIQILRDVLGLEAVFVETLLDGGMNPSDLRQKLADNTNHPALVVATIGTPFKGSIDQIDAIQNALRGYLSYLHVDAALFGGYLPYTSYAGEVSHQSKSNPTVKRYDSIAVSCHKFFSFPTPAGLFITTKDHFEEFNGLYAQIHYPEYIGHVPGTITCSRDSVKPAEFYFFSTALAMAKQAEDAHSILKNTDYLLEQMQIHFRYLLPTRSSPLSNTIYFKKPSDWIVKKYSLASIQLHINQKKQDYSHVVVMPHASNSVLTAFLTDLDKDSVSQFNYGC